MLARGKHSSLLEIYKYLYIMAAKGLYYIWPRCECFKAVFLTKPERQCLFVQNITFQSSLILRGKARKPVLEVKGIPLR